jgi:SAM-dependent methyltransferase
MAARYDTIGLNYVDLRKPDPRFARAIHAALGQAVSVLNVGAGSGNYEPVDRQMTAVEPSLEMIRKRPASAAKAIQASAEALPFGDAAFDASMAVLTVHHWADAEAGLREMRRVTRGPVVLLTFDPAVHPWLVDYIPELATLDDERMPKMADYERWLGPVRVAAVPVPHDCSDGFLYAYWRRPEAYLDARLRSGSSSFWAIDNADAGLERLRHDLVTGEWERRYADLHALDAYDAGYRLVVSDTPNR